MNKVEQLHLDVIEDNDIECTDLNCSLNYNTVSHAIGCAQVTENIAIGFLKWYDNSGYLVDAYFEKIKTTPEYLFKEFLKDLEKETK